MIMFLTGPLYYLEITFVAVLVNVVPAFAPPTWLVLALYKINHPYLNFIALAFAGVVGSVIGRFLMYKYSEVLGKYVPKKEVENLRWFRKFVGETNPRVFLETFLFSLSPLPSNFLFIAFGMSEVNIQPILVGFFLGRLLSYSVLIDASFRSFSYFSGYIGSSQATLAADILGLVFAVIVIFVRWKKIYIKSHELKLRIGKWMKKEA